MTQFDIRVPFYSLSGVNLNDKATIISFGEILKQEYIKRIIDAIDSPLSRYKGQWEPKTSEFNDLLISLGFKLPVKIDSKILKKLITVRISNSDISLNFSSIIRSGSRSFLDYLRILEFGTLENVARPLIIPIRSKLINEIPDIWSDYSSGIIAEYSKRVRVIK